MAITWADSADEHGIPHDEAVYAMLHGDSWDAWEEPRPNFGPTRLWIGPSRYGTLEVIAEIKPPRDLDVFHVMQLRQTIADKVNYKP